MKINSIDNLGAHLQHSRFFLIKATYNNNRDKFPTIYQEQTVFFEVVLLCVVEKLNQNQQNCSQVVFCNNCKILNEQIHNVISKGIDQIFKIKLCGQSSWPDKKFLRGRTLFR